MSYQAVRAYFGRFGLLDHITEREQTGDTVKHAAQTIGCSVGEIAKTLSFLVAREPILVVMAGDVKVNSAKFKAQFHQKAEMIPWDRVEALIGHAPGGVCPFALRPGVAVYLDLSLRRFPVIHTAAGIDTATIRLTLAELEEHSHPVQWVDVCKG